VAAIQAYVATVKPYEEELHRLSRESKEQHAQKSILKRLLTSPSHVSEIHNLLRGTEKHVSYLLSLCEQLQAGADKTPTSVEEQREMLKELKHMKKEIAQEKRELNDAMRQIRLDARHAGAKVGTGMGLLLSNPTSRRLDRMSIRLNKEAALAPHEDAKAGIERRGLAIERAILWVERFR
jgi:small-conductance mechanosensitive channel